MKKFKFFLILLLCLFSIITFTNGNNSKNSNNNNVNNNIVNMPNINTNTINDENTIFKPKNTDSDDMSLIVSLLDGSIYSFQYNNGKLKWDISAGKSLYSTSQEAPKYSLEESEIEDLDPDDEYSYNLKKQERLNRIEEDKTSLLIPNIDGSGEFYQYQSGNIQKLPFTIHDIISSSHFLVNNKESQDENVLYVGSKSTSVLIVDSNTGEIIKSSNGDGLWENSGDNSCPSDLSRKDTLLFTRSDYRVLALDPLSGSEKWNLSIGEFTPFSSQSSQFSNEGLIFEGNIEVLPNNNNQGSYKLFVQKKKSTASYWEVMLPSAPVNVYAHSSSKNILKKLSFNRRLSSQVTSLLPYGNGMSTDIMIPSNTQPTFVFDSFDGNYFITSNERDLKNRNNKPNNNDNNSNSNQMVITDGNENKSSTINTNNNNNKHSNNNQSKTTSDIDSILSFLNDFQIKILLITLIVLILSKYIKNWFFTQKNTVANNNNNNKSNKNNNTPKKTPKKKRRNNRVHLEEEEVEVEEEIEDNQQQQLQQPKEPELLSIIKELEKPIAKEIIKEEPTITTTTPTIVQDLSSKKILLENGNIKIGKLEISNKILGTGSCGTIVYKGYLDGRKVAIKKMLSQFIKFADREVSILLHSDEHMNVVRYYAKEEDQEFIYLALSFCKFTLDSFVTSNLKQSINNNTTTTTTTNTTKITINPISPTITPITVINITPQIKQMIFELLSGLSHLHGLNIVHRDIKPQNILVDPNYRIKISDMGLGKLLDVDDASLTFNSEGHGWQAAEYLNGTNKNTKKVDIFSLGCVIYYLITGLNPFGTRYNREKNVLKGKFDIELISSQPNLYQLIHSMIQFDPEKRPSIQECLEHPFFWNTHKRISFLASSSDYLEFEKPTSPLNVEIDGHIDSVAEGGDWWLYMDKILIDNIGRYRKYNGKSIRDLLRVIRNKFNHYRDLSQEEKTCLGPLPDGFLGYFETKFPKLLITTYLFIAKNLKSEAYFKQYFIEDTTTGIVSENQVSTKTTTPSTTTTRNPIQTK